MMWGIHRSLRLLAAGTILMGAAAASAQTGIVQMPPPPGAMMQSLTPDHGAELRGYLTTLADNPQNLDALIGAGRAALAMGDPEAALTFLGRADQISPSNYRVKAGMASALAQLGEPEEALRWFAQASATGAPETDIAADRGLARDMIGDPRHAQQDYLIALRRGDDPEVRRRLALSLAISGQREAALRAIDAQLRRNDRAAWRAQAFILALTGDAAGADRTAASVMPPGTAQQMAPFLARLHSLSPAQKAMAVHLGQFPSDGQPRTQIAHFDTSPDPAAVALALGRPPAINVHVPTARTQVAATPSTTTGTARRRVFEPDPSDRFGLRTASRSEPRRVAEDRRPAAPAPPPAQAQTPTPPPPVQPPAVASRPAEIAVLETRWAGAPYPAQQPAAQPPVAARPAPPPAAPTRPT